jgi:hypothetical protein
MFEKWKLFLEAKCKTPGAIYHFDINNKSVGVEVELPSEIDLDEEKAKELENEIHDALEDILARFFD